MDAKVPFFLESVAAHIHKNYAGQEDSILVVIPNRRGALYLKKHLAEKVSGFAWVPQITAAETFIEALSGLPAGGELTLTFDLYEAYLGVMQSESVSFEQFLRWAPQVLQDFNEVDRYLVDSEKVFENLKNIREIESWSLAEDELSPMQQRYLDFMRSMGAVYKRLKRNVLQKNYGWQGLSYRLAHEKLVRDGYSLPYKKIIFAGFNAVNLAEEKILAYLVEHKLADLLWDADRYYLDNHRHEAGAFLRRHLARYKPLQGFVSDHLSNEAHQVAITGVAGRMAQVAAAAREIEKLIAQNQSLERTALVLCDETLLLPMLSVLPPAVQSVNVTLGYPASVTPLYDLYDHLLTMQLNKKEARKESAFYFKDVLAVLYNPFFAELCAEGFFVNEVIRRLNRSNAVYIRTGLLHSWFGEHFAPVEELLSGSATAFAAVRSFCSANARIIERLHARGGRSIELETALAFQKELNALFACLEKHPDINLRGLRVLLRQVLGQSAIPFYGEPLSGLQVMGVLETRTLDFDNVIMLSVNEGVLPSGKSSNSFIPDDLKRHLQMPLHGEKDAIYSYHFYRLLQRARNISLIYNTETDTFGKGEKSRFITQLLAEWPEKNAGVKIGERILSLPVTPAALPYGTVIAKDEKVIARLLEKAQSERGLSPTSFNTYKECTLKFYLRFIAGVREADEVEEDIEASALGNIIHAVLEELYTPCVGKPLEADTVTAMQKLAAPCAEKHFAAYYEEASDENGKKALAIHVIKKYLANFLAAEKKNLQAAPGTRLTVRFVEKEVGAKLLLGDGTPVNIQGKSDRIDEVNGNLRIVDYKSSVHKSNDRFDFSSLDEVFSDTKYSKALQLLTYAWLAWKEKLAPAAQIKPCIIAFRSEKPLYMLSQNKAPLVFSEAFFEEFEEKLRAFVADFFNTDKKFEPTTETDACEYCAYKMVCNRH
jgi:ATP-dependent helicase/nuclease subunit B